MLMLHVLVCCFLCVSELVQVCIKMNRQNLSLSSCQSSAGYRLPWGVGVGLSTRHTDDSPLSASPQLASGLVNVRVFVCSAPAETSANLIITD